MNKINRAVTVVSLATALLASAAAPTAQAAERVGKGSPTDWIAKTLADIRGSYQRQGETNRGPVTFVAGNDLWQPGNHFTNGTNWLALSCRSTSCALEPAVLTVKKQSWQGHYDDQPFSGQHLHFSRTGAADTKVLAWFKTTTGLPWLKPSDVTTYFGGGKVKQAGGQGTVESAIDLPTGETATLVPLLVKRDLICQVSKVPLDQCQENGLLLLQLRSAAKRQMLLGNFGSCSGTVPADYVIWAGDIDGDGKPDYLISFVDETGPTHLYLSSMAKAGDLVGLGGLYNSPPQESECGGGQDWINN